MKRNDCRKVRNLCALLFFCLAANLYGQTGNTQSNPIVAGSFSAAFNYSNSQNTNNFTNNYVSQSSNSYKGQSSKDVFYRFTLTRKMEVTIKHCGSTHPDTYLHLLDASGNYITSNDDYSGTGACSSIRHSYLKRELDAGTYYVVSEGFSSNNGVILTQISGTVVYLPGDKFNDPVVAGTFNSSFQYTNTQNTVHFTDQYVTRTSYITNDVFYRFTLNRKMHVTLSHCGSAIDTYMYLLDTSGNTITFNDDYSGDGACSSSTRHSFIQRMLEAGTYYIVSEGYNGSGSITTNITGYASDEFDYPDIPNTYSTDPEAVGSPGGALNVSPAGGAVYSIPVEVPAGIGGLQPSLAITYNSLSGNGSAGWGTNLSGLSAITRAPKDIYHDGTAKGLTHLANEAYYLNGQRLIYSSGTTGQEGAVYYPESDPFTKITVHGTYNTSTANTWFEVQASDGMKYYYGNTASGRQTYYVGSAPRIHAWYLDYVEDPLGNYMTYTYNNWNYFMYPSSITYGGNKNTSTGLQNTVSFSYEYRNDATPFVVEENVKGSMSYRLKTITSKTGNNVYRTYDLQYNTTGSDNSTTIFSRLTSITEKNGAGEALKPVKLEWTYLPSFSQNSQTPSLPSTYIPLGVHNNTVAYSDQNYIAADLNGDGLDDLVGIFPYTNYSYYINSGNYYCSNTNIAFVNRASLNSSGNVQFTTPNIMNIPLQNASFYDLGASFSIGNWSERKGSPSVLDFDGDGVNDLLVPNVSIIPELDYKKVEFRFVAGRLNKLSVDFNLKYSNEMPEYATGDINNDGKGDIVCIEKGHSSNKYPCDIIGLNQGTELHRASLNLTLSSKPEKIFVSDYNGDGLQDILIFYNGGYTIFWNQGNGISNTTFSDSKKTTGTNIGNVWRIWTGDFNGDGLADFLMSATMDNKWYFALNNGNGTFTKQLACTLEIYDQDFAWRDDDHFQCYVYDSDFDGKSDVIINKAMYDKVRDCFFCEYYGRFNKTHTYWMRSTGSSLVELKHATSNMENERYAIGDFNGDGQVELMNYGYNCYSGGGSSEWRMYRNSNFDAKTGKVKSVTDGYGATTNISYASFANDGFYIRETGNSYPIVNYTLPIHAVKTVTVNNGVAGNQTINYQYKGLKAHLQGRGLLGLTSQTVSNTTLGTVTESGVKSLDTTFYIPSKTYTKTTVDGKTAETNVTLTVTDKGSKKYFAYPATQTDKDLDGNTVTITRQFNTSCGYMTEEKADFGNDMYKTVQYGTYVLAGKSYKPQLITRIQKHTDDTSAFTQKTYITYNAAKGYQEQVVENYGSSLPLTTNYTYDALGNVATSKVSGSGVTQLVTYRVYDVNKRFVVKTYTSPASSVNSFTYNTWGNVLTEKDETNVANILTTTHTYDNWGNRMSTVFPDGRKTTFHSGWNNNSKKRFFTLTQGTGQPWVKTWYDNKGHEVLSETVGPKSMNVQKKTAYNSKGQVLQKQVITGSLTTTETYGYDGRGRVNSFSNSAGQSITYTCGNRMVTTLTNGKTYTKMADAWGNIKSSTDPEASVSYTYKSLGKPQSVTTGGATFAMTYYDTGMQQTLTDPNAGTSTYTYDAAGRLIRSVDGKGKETVNAYDMLGRIKTATIDGVETAYTYGTAGYDLLRLVKQQTGNNSITYFHDKYGRVTTETRQIDGAGTLSFSYSYNTKGELYNTIYPNGLTVSRQYDTYGNLLKVLAGTQTIWELTGETGLVTTSKLGGSLTSTITRNSQGLLANLKTVKDYTVLHNTSYVFNGATGNLTSRNGMNGQTESFLYDDLDRLTDVRQGNATVMSMTYLPNGNIDTKTGLGQYEYEDLPHAVSFVENTDELISSNNQNITYTAFDKVSRITEKVGADNYQLDVVYGPDRQRWKSTLKKDNSITKTIVFAGDYETITENGTTKNLYYISGGNGLAAIYVKQSGQTDNIYYPCTDHLGSIVKLITNTGSEVFKASYDAWGNRTVTTNTFAFHRGYTGHEHLTEFKLINMNGRMYDPVLGRFLSPDPFVQAPDFSQSFNRYSYCLNNPLVYTDPDGEFWHLIIGALIGGVVNLATNWNNVDGFWDGLLTFAVGAGAGAAVAATGGAGASIWAVTGVSAAGGAVTSASNNIVAQTGANLEGFGNINWGSVGTSTLIGGVAGAAGGSAGYAASNMSFVVNGISSPVLRSAVVSPIAAGAGHVAGGTTANLFAGQSFGDAFTNSFDGIWQDMAVGGALGVATTIGISYANKVNPWTGKDLNVNQQQTISEWNYGDHKSQTKWENQMKQRGWTEQQINEALSSGKSYPAINNINPANSATRYVHPTTGRSIVIDNATRSLLQVGGDGFKW